MKQTLSRRSFTALAAATPLLAACAWGASAARALADEATDAALEAAQARYDALKLQVDELAAQYRQMCVELEATLSQIEEKTQQIAALQAEGERLRLEAGDDDEALAQLEAQQAELETQRAELEALRDQKDAQLAEMRERQDEATRLLSEADAEVKELTAQRDRELAARAEVEAQAQAKADEEARAQAQADADAKAREEADAKAKEELYAQLTDEARVELQELLASGAYAEAYGGTSVARVIEACMTVPPSGEGYCATWVTEVFMEAGIGRFTGNACDMYADWCDISDFSAIKPGMIVATPSHNWTDDGQLYGHVGIYVGNGKVVDNLGYIRVSDLAQWVRSYSGVVAPRCGWLGGVVLVSEGRFYDVDPDAWFADYVSYVSDASLMNGYDDADGQPSGAFGPFDAVSRCQVAAVLCRHATGQTPQGSGDCFYDVPADAWYAGVVEWCHRSGIVTGERDDDDNETGYFRPDDSITREQLATMVHRYATMLGVGAQAGDISGFPDAGEVSAYAVEALAWCNLHGIVTGDTASGQARLNPQAGATRAQMAKILTVLVRDVL